MPKALDDLTELQLRLLEVLWELDGATANQVHARLEGERSLTRKTIGTLLHRLERQGVLRHVEEGREFVYHARFTREDVRRSTVRSVAGQLFPGQLPAMVAHALESGEVQPGDLERIRALLDEWEG